MALSRRNLLLGMVVLVIGAGVIGASGAFSSVQAERTMNIETSGDSSALLGLSANDNAIASDDTADTGTDTVAVLQFDNTQINENAVTVFEAAFTVTNNGNNNIGEFYIEEDSSIGVEQDGPVDFLVNGNSIVGQGNAYTDGIGASGGTIDVTVEIDTLGSTTQADLPNEGTITIVANENAS